MRKYLLLSTAAAIAAPAQAEQWYLVAQADDILAFDDAASMTKVGDFLQLDLVEAPLSSFTVDGVTGYYRKGTMQLNCATNQYRELTRVAYNLERKPAGELQVDTSWMPVTPGTFAAQHYEFACKLGVRETLVTDPFDYADEYWYYYDYDY